MNNYEAALSSPQGSDFVAQVTRLYLVVHGRPPDPGGLRAHVEHMHAGKSLRDLALAFLDSEEFNRQAADCEPARVLFRNALGTDDVARFPENYESPCDLVVTLVRSSEVAARLPILPALYPDGVKLTEPRDYRVWLAGRPRAGDRACAPASVSWIMTLTQPDPPWVEEALRSVFAQSWPGLEMVISAWRFGPTLRQTAASDRRVRLVRAPFWYDEGGLFNYALARCRGTFAGLIGPDERLDGNAAAAVATATNTADIVLSDEDAIDAEGLRHSPRLGEAWDPDRMLACGRPGMLLVRTSLLRKVGGMRRQGSTADLLLRASLRAGPDRVVHVPWICLSRRGQVGSRLGAEAQAAQDYLRGSGQAGCTIVPHHGTMRIIHPLPQKPPRASIIIATRNRADLLGRCLDGLLTRTAYPDMEIVIVDNGSTEGAALSLLNTVSRDPQVRVLSHPGPFNWAALNNLGVSRMSGDVAILLNNDTDVIDPEWLRELVSQAIRPDVGAVGAKLLYPDGTIQHAGVVLGQNEHALHMWRRMPGDVAGYLDSLVVTRQATAVTGACLAIRRKVYDAVGGCDAEHLPVTWNDVDLCLRIRARGLRVIWTPHARLVHLEQATRGSDDTPENDARFRREQAWMRERWGAALGTDPFLNANLLPSETEPRLAVHLRPPTRPAAG